MRVPSISFVDVLILTALKEERFVLDRWIDSQNGGGNADGTKEEIGASVTFNSGRSANVKHFQLGAGPTLIHVALANLSGMGNVWAVADTTTLIRALLPKCIILVGTAGGRKDGRCNKGDVGYAKTICYSSLAKIMEAGILKKLRELVGKQGNGTAKSLLKQLVKAMRDGDGTEASRIQLASLTYPDINIRKIDDLIEASVFFTTTSDVVAKEPDWGRRATSVFAKENVKLVEDFNLEIEPDQQGYIYGVPQARPVAVASGEFVVASREVQRHIARLYEQGADKRTKTTPEAIGMYEMEGYGVAMACKLDDVGFGLVKGYSDLADEKKDDKCRLAAIASASAFTWELIQKQSFVTSLQNRSRRTVHGVVPCFWTRPPDLQPCSPRRELTSLSPDQNICNLRNCTGTGMDDAFREKQVFAVRVFEAIEARDYSRFIAHYSTDRSSMTALVFPYTPHGILEFLAREQGFGESVADLRSAIEARSSKARKPADIEFVRRMCDVIDTARQAFGHFQECDKHCLTVAGNVVNDMTRRKETASQRHFFQRAKVLCRILVLEGCCHSKFWTGERALLNLLYPALLGLHVPTFLVEPWGQARGTKRSFVTDDITYIREWHDVKDGVTSGQRDLCARYLGGSESLILLGKCSEGRDQVRSNVLADLQPIMDEIAKAADSNNWKLTRLRRLSFKGIICEAIRVAKGATKEILDLVGLDKIDATDIEDAFTEPVAFPTREAC